MEVRGDSEMGWFIKALDLGWHIAPDGSDDTHREQWGTSGRWTVVLAPGLSRESIVGAIKSRHCYSTRDRNCRLTFTLNEAVMGDVISDPVQAATADVLVEDPDQGDVIEAIELYADGHRVHAIEPGAAQGRLTLDLSPDTGGHYYFVKVIQADGNLIYSAPIWITVP
jgi:hypothetical protein